MDFLLTYLVIERPHMVYDFYILPFLNQGQFIRKNNNRRKPFQNFDAVQIVGLTPDSIEGSKWHMKQFYGSWITGATAGGCINHINTFSNNPQFLIRLTGSKAEYTCVIGLIQKSAKQAGSGKIGSLQIGNISNALSFYRSQNVLGWSKFFVPDQKFIYILWQSQTFCARQKDDLHSVKLFFVPAQKFLKRH